MREKGGTRAGQKNSMPLALVFLLDMDGNGKEIPAVIRSSGFLCIGAV